MIPKRIHYIWFGQGREPEIFDHCIKSWKTVCPDYEIIRWDESNINFDMSPYTKFTRLNGKLGHIGDYVRLWILYNYGGIYLDVDVEMLKSFNGLLGYDAFFSFQDHKRVNLGNGFGSIKGNILLKKMMDTYDEFGKELLSTDSLKTSPEIDTPILVSNGLKNNNTLQIINNCIFLPKEYMAPKSFYSQRLYLTNNTISIHHFDGSWTDSHRKSSYDVLFKLFPSFLAENIILIFEKIKIILKRT